MNLVPIEAHTAAVRTATVELRTIVIGKKQLTLAVYQQIPQRDLLDFGKFGKDVPLVLGTVWGWVNHCNAKECKWVDDAHRHFIWECEGRLYRDYIYLKWMSNALPLDTRYETEEVFKHLMLVEQIYLSI